MEIRYAHIFGRLREELRLAMKNGAQRTWKVNCRVRNRDDHTVTVTVHASHERPSTSPVRSRLASVRAPPSTGAARRPGTCHCPLEGRNAIAAPPAAAASLS
jgi:hypothetical protein